MAKSTKMDTVNIKGKEYVTVNSRVKAFRENYAGYSLESEIVTLTEDSCVMRAVIRDENGRVMATGFAQEDKSSSYINKTSFVENCETSAWGRALGNFGIGIDTSICSADELSIANAKQKVDKYTKTEEEEQKYVDAINNAFGQALEDKSSDAIGDEEVRKLTVALFGAGIEEQKVLDNYKVKAISELTRPQWEEAMRTCKTYMSRK